MKYKKFYFIFLVLIIFFNLLYYFGALSPLKQILPSQIKNFLTNTILYIPSKLKQHSAVYKLYEREKKYNYQLETKIDRLETLKDAVNTEVFPKTQFIELEYSSYNISSIEKKKNIYTSEITSPFYLEIYNDYLLINSRTGKFFYIPIDSFKNNKPEQILINNNLKSNIEITDTLVHKNDLFVAFYDREKDCDNISIYKTKIDMEYLKFEKFYESTTAIGKCERRDTVAGRITLYKHENNYGLLASVPSVKDMDIPDTMDQFNVSKEFKFSGLIFIDFDKKKNLLFAVGFRNPQGLVVTSNNNILSSEHGPRGGDEINNINFSKNYGWPTASYGENYYKNYKESEEYQYKKNHKKFGYEEPVFAFVPSIAPSQLIEIDENFSKKWKQTILLSTLKSKSLYRMTFDENYSRLITYEKIFVGKRIRDIVYGAKHGLIFLAEETGQGTVGVINVKRTKNK